MMQKCKEKFLSIFTFSTEKKISQVQNTDLKGYKKKMAISHTRGGGLKSVWIFTLYFFFYLTTSLRAENNEMPISDTINQSHSDHIWWCSLKTSRLWCRLAWADTNMPNHIIFHKNWWFMYSQPFCTFCQISTAWSSIEDYS